MKGEARLNDVETKVKKIISEVLRIDPAEVKDNFSITKDLGANSIELVVLVGLLEESFEIEIDDIDVEKLIIVKNAIEYTRHQVKNKL